jgi:hypothetical protein
MIKQIIKLTFVLAILFGCTNNEKTCIDKGLEPDCCPPLDTAIKDLPKPSITSINIFLDISGSMDGFMPNAMPATKFQIIIPEIISKLNTEYAHKVNFFSLYDNQNNVRKDDIEKARNELQHGNFAWADNTYLPIIFDTIINKYLKNDDVDILVSDCIYSPKKKDEKISDIAITDIRDKIKPNVKTFATSIFCLNSEFRNKANKVDSSPYYIILFGKQQNLSSINKLLIKSFSTYTEKYDEVHFGMKYNTPFCSILPYTENTGNYIASPCVLRDSAYLSIQDVDLSISSNQMEFWIGIDLVAFPSYMKTTKYLDSNLIVTLNKGLAKILDIKTKDSFLSVLNQDDKQIADRCTHFIKVNISQLNDNISVLNFSLKNTRPDWIKSINISDINSRETNKEKTYGLENIVKGIEEAYNITETSYFIKDLKISLIKK